MSMTQKQLYLKGEQGTVKLHSLSVRSSITYMNWEVEIFLKEKTTSCMNDLKINSEQPVVMQMTFLNNWTSWITWRNKTIVTNLVEKVIFFKMK